MNVDERAQWVEYLLKKEFAGYSSARWLLTHWPPAGQTQVAPQGKGAQSGMEAEIASRRMALEALPDGELRQRYQNERVRTLEAELDGARKKIAQLKQANACLRAKESTRAIDEPLATRTRRTLLCIIGALASTQKLDLAEPYKAGVVLETALAELGVKVGHRSIGDHLKQVPEAMDSRRT